MLNGLLKIVVLSTITLLTLASTSHAKSSTPIIVGVESQTYLPYYHVNNGNYEGFARDLLDDFAAKEKLTLIYKPFPINDLFYALKDGQIDLKFPDNPYWQHTVKSGIRVDYSEPVVTYVDGGMVLDRNKDMGLDNLKVLGIIKGFTPLEYQHLVLYDLLKTIEYNSIPDMMNALIEEKVDAIYADLDSLRYQLKNTKRNYPKITFNPWLPYTAQSYMMSTSSRWLVLKKFDEYMKNNRQQIEELKRQHGLRNSWEILKGSNH